MSVMHVKYVFKIQCRSDLQLKKLAPVVHVQYTTEW